MIRRGSTSAEREWTLLVSWLLLLTSSTIVLLTQAAALRVAPAMDDEVTTAVVGTGSFTVERAPFEADEPNAPSALDETDRERLADTSGAPLALTSTDTPFAITLQRVHLTRRLARLPAYWTTFGIRDLRGPPSA